MTIHAKMAMPDSQPCPLNIHLINNVEYICFPALKLINSDNPYTFSCGRNAQVTSVEKPQLKIISFLIINIDN